MLPLWALQFFSYYVLVLIGVPHQISEDVGYYTRLMVGVSFISIFESTLQNLIINLHYSKTVAMVSIFCGMGNTVTRINKREKILCFYLEIYR